MGEARRLCVGRINAAFVIRLARARAITSGQASDEESLKISGFDEQKKFVFGSIQYLCLRCRVYVEEHEAKAWS
jgi:hypothetical protein